MKGIQTTQLMASIAKVEKKFKDIEKQNLNHQT